MKNNFKRYIYLLTIISLFSFSTHAVENLKAEEIIAKHLDSIGTKEKRAEIKNSIAIAASQFFIVRSGGARVAGKTVFLSEREKIFFGSNYESPNYPFEKISFDGNKVNVAFISPGIRSTFGSFILSHKEIFSEGLFNGSLSTSWSLLNLEARNAKIRTAGKKKINGRETYILEYYPKSGTDLSIRLFFDAETFQHVRTEYKQTLSAGLGNTPEASSRQLETRYSLIEEFSDYKNENGLMMPHSYRVYLSIDGQRGTNEFEWKFDIVQFMFNQNLDAKSFDVNAQ